MSEKRCSLCGALRINGACSLLGCRDPLFDQREEDKIAAAEERGRRRCVEEMQLGTCRVYRHGCADGRAIESRLSDRWREYALPHPERDNCLEWVALAPRDSARLGIRDTENANDPPQRESFFAHDEPSEILDGTHPLSEDSE